MSIKDVLADSNVTKRSKKWSSIQQSKRRGESTKKGKVRKQIWKKNLKYKGDWLQVQGTLMLVATVIATVTFQGAVNPPGGTWQQDHANELQNAGTAIMASKASGTYTSYFMANSISFLASVRVILLIVSGFPMKNKIFGWLLSLAMTVAVSCLTFAYITGTAMVCGNKIAHSYLLVLLRIWYGVVGIVILCCIVIPFFIWLLKKFLGIFTTFRY